jgi:hypothetical protein
MSAIASRPPGRSAAAAARKTRSLSGTRLMTPLEMTASTVPGSAAGPRRSPRRTRAATAPGGRAARALGVTEALGQRAAEHEVVIAVGVACDVAVHRADLAAQLVDGDG